MSELGRFLVTKQPKTSARFKTPGLRNLLVTQPYFHDGSQATLWDIVDHYNKGGVQNPFLDGGIMRAGADRAGDRRPGRVPSTLTSDRYEPLAKKELARQRALSRTTRPQRDTAAATGRRTPASTDPLATSRPDPTLEDPSRIGGR